MTIQNQAGETPRDVARRFGQLACVKILGGDPGILHIMAALIPSCTREMISVKQCYTLLVMKHLETYTR